MTEKTLTVEAVIENLASIIEFVETEAFSAGIAPEKAAGVPLAIEEAFVNICSYAYQGHTGDVTISCKTGTDVLTIEISDMGTAFDILSIPDPDTSAEIDKREIGGLGVFFIRRFTDDVSYRRENSSNILRLVFRRASNQGDN